MSNAVVLPQLEVPSKWDIIPIHASDVAAFKRCRRYWNWSSPTRTNLRKRVDISGVNFPLWYGSGAHYALERMYHPTMPRDPVEAFSTWYDYQWNGGIVTYDWLERLMDADPVPVTEEGNGVKFTLAEALVKEHPFYRVRGLKQIHPDPIHEEFEFYRDLGVGMMTFYKKYAEKNDNFVVMSAESKFSVPLGFEAKDFREESPNYGKMLEVHARGTRDAIIYNPDSERWGLLDHKTAGEIGPDYFVKLSMDEQVGTYFWATEYEAELLDLPYKRVDRFIYNVLRKAYPKPPTILKNGISPSINRKEESTTAEMFAAYIDEAGIRELYDNDAKWQAYYNWLVQMGDANFVQRQWVTRNKHQVQAIKTHYRMVAEEMLDPHLKIYPTPSGNFLCTTCQFRNPCLAADDGSDYVHVLADGFEENRGR